MSKPIVIAHHLVWTAYGWWLPNDPRGSGSNIVASDVLRILGDLHHGRKIIQPASLDVRDFYDEARDFLQFPLRTFDEQDRNAIAFGFADAIAENNYTCYACAVMPDHVHLVLRKHRDSSEQMIEHLKASSRLRLSNGRAWSPDHPTWTGGYGYKVFLEHPDDIERTVDYVKRNPDGMRLPPQHWPFVSEYDGWPLHEGHSEKSPYVKRLKSAGRYHGVWKSRRDRC